MNYFNYTENTLRRFSQPACLISFYFEQGCCWIDLFLRAKNPVGYVYPSDVLHREEENSPCQESIMG